MSAPTPDPTPPAKRKKVLDAEALGIEEFGQDTLLQHLGEEEKILGAVVPPIFQNSLFLFEDQEEFDAEAHKMTTSSRFYSRVGNPTLNVVEQKIAMLEGTARAKVMGSGMAAISAAVMSCVKAGSHAILPDTSYGPTRELLQYLEKFGVSYTLVDGAEPSEVLDQIRPETSLVFLESPSSILFRLQDIEAITKECRARGIATAIDNTYAAGVFQQPHKMGVDIVTHTASKYLGGHSDLIGGVICTTEDRMQDLVKNEVSLIGGIMAPLPAWILLRGVRTLKIRLKRHQESANKVAAWLEQQPWVERVYHLGLPSFPQRELYEKQMTGSNGLFSFQPKSQKAEEINAFTKALHLFGLGVSWGGFESLVVHIPMKAKSLGSMTRLVRLHIGLEDPEDLMKDLAQAARHAFG
jgi:cystathionine beta-lyase